MSGKLTKEQRKALKSPDEFVQNVRPWFESLEDKGPQILWTLGVIIAISIGIAVYFESSSANEVEARDALFKAKATLTEELEAYAKKTLPPEALNKKKEDDAKGLPFKPPQAEEETLVDKVAFKSFDPAKEIAKAVEGLEQVSADFGGTRAGHDAEMVLGNLFLNHGQDDSAKTWFDKAFRSARGNFEKASSLLAVGHVLENKQAYKEAIDNYRQALALNSTLVKADLLMALARCYTELDQKEEAIKTYDQIISDLPDGSEARNAKVLKSMLN